jgi:CYTH domain-containing protein
VERSPGAGRYVVDVFAGPLAGLILAELELGDDEPPVARPPWALVEVTGDDRYSGGRLAALVEGEVGPLLVC